MSFSWLIFIDGGPLNPVNPKLSGLLYKVFNGIGSNLDSVVVVELLGDCGGEGG